jgi:hypothetical protein
MHVFLVCINDGNEAPRVKGLVDGNYRVGVAIYIHLLALTRNMQLRKM